MSQNCQMLLRHSERTEMVQSRRISREKQNHSHLKRLKPYLRRARRPQNLQLLPLQLVLERASVQHGTRKVVFRTWKKRCLVIWKTTRAFSNRFFWATRELLRLNRWTNSSAEPCNRRNNRQRLQRRRSVRYNDASSWSCVSLKIRIHFVPPRPFYIELLTIYIEKDLYSIYKLNPQVL